MTATTEHANILTLEPQTDYELIDSGEGEKFERFGNITTVRPDPQALWLKSDPARWAQADATFIRTGPKGGTWKTRRSIPERWTIELSGLTLYIRPTSFKHTGLFPEQASNWSWMHSIIRESGRKPTVLNLFGYTGAASLACAQAGALVTHVDSSKTAITWANENMKASGLEPNIRWILEDAHAFVKKELRRGKKYDGILLDPPTFGHGTKGELWKIEKQFTELLSDCMELLSDEPIFFLLNGYAAGYSCVAYANNISPLVKKYGGSIEYGELTIRETSGNRLLPAGIFARWKKDQDGNA